MRKMLFTVAASMLFVLSFATLAMAQSINGDWEVKIVSPQGERTAPVSLKQSGDNVTGKLGPYDISGSVKGTAVTLKYTLKFNEMDIPTTMTGTLNGEAMGGKVDFGGMAEGEWSAKKSGGAAAPAAPTAPAAAATSSSGAAAGAGEWSVVFSTPNGDAPTKMTIKQEGENLTGESTGEGPMKGPYAIKGTLKSDVLEIKFTIKFEGNDMPITMKGKLTGAEMKGSADYGGLAEGEFKGKKN